MPQEDLWLSVILFQSLHMPHPWGLRDLIYRFQAPSTLSGTSPAIWRMMYFGLPLTSS